MAFEMNIEADQISDSDFNLLHSFVKIPLMILGGVLGRGSGSNLEDDDDDEGMVDAAMARPTRRNDDPMDFSALTTSLDHINAASTAAGVEQSSSPSNRIVSDSDIDESDSQNEADGLKRSKKMSWSDSMGHRLVEYDDEVRYQGAY
jgi:hypothetical protein